ncbi:sensor histidine kinase [Bradyrhizobium murdochi]|uniref:sensor histidine kinase n=1 Tax=Bradyrhizobium murdochi TaxID=1038859 RepID=UPI0003F54C2B|nr:ATP-binding protein [Bradyrhizobium murdochi]
MKRRSTIEARKRYRIALVWCLFALLALICSLQTVARAATPEPKRVMILHSFGQDFRPWAEYARTIRAELIRQSPWPLDIHDHSLVTARSSDEDPEVPFVNYLMALGAKRPPDLIVCVGAPAANFVQRQRDRLFPATPLVITAIEQRRVNFARLGENDTVVSVSHDFSASFANILRVLPGTKKIIIVIGTSPNERFWLEEVRKEMPPFENRVEFSWTDKIPFEEFLRSASALPQHTVLFWGLMNVDAAGVVHEGDSALKRLHAVANAPIFSYDDGFFGDELVGGPMHSVAGGSRRTADVAVRILGGEKAGDIRLPPTRYAAAKFDWRQMQRWGISESSLPPDSQVYFREPSVWETYRWQVAMVCLVVLLQAVLISVLLYERRRRRFAEVEARRRMSELAHVNRYSMAGELTASIAHELNQPLGSILVNTETAALMLERTSLDKEELKEILSDIRRDDQRAGEVIKRLRSLLMRGPFEAKEIDVNEVVAEALDLVSGLTHARDVTVESILPAEPLRVLGDRIQLQQVLLNLIINAADAMEHLDKLRRRMVVRTAQDRSFAEIEIVDNGPGILAANLSEVFEPLFTTKPNGMGMGLSIARTIVEAHDGQISAENRAGQGAAFRIRLPLAPSAGAAA